MTAGCTSKSPSGLTTRSPRSCIAAQMRSAREQDDVGAGAREPRADVAADRAGAGDDDSHDVFGVNASATTRRWILPVAVRGMASVM